MMLRLAFALFLSAVIACQSAVTAPTNVSFQRDVHITNDLWIGGNLHVAGILNYGSTNHNHPIANITNANTLTLPIANITNNTDIVLANRNVTNLYLLKRGYANLGSMFTTGSVDYVVSLTSNETRWPHSEFFNCLVLGNDTTVGAELWFPPVVLPIPGDLVHTTLVSSFRFDFPTNHISAPGASNEYAFRFEMPGPRTGNDVGTNYVSSGTYWNDYRFWMTNTTPQYKTIEMRWPIWNLNQSSNWSFWAPFMHMVRLPSNTVITGLSGVMDTGKTVRLLAVEQWIE